MKVSHISSHELMLSRGRLLIQVQLDPSSISGKYLVAFSSLASAISMAIV
jgi:hypothetical protein